MCLSSYPTPNDEIGGDSTARAWIIRSDDLETWDKPELLRLKGPEVPVEQMGRIIDPYIFRDKDSQEKWWCFYKQNGVSMSWSSDLSNWTYAGRMDCGENACILVSEGEYVLFHSPQNGMGVKRSRNLKEWRDEELITLGQERWPWSQGRLTAGFVLDLRDSPEIGKYVMFFHGATREGRQNWDTHGNASLGLAWSDDLRTWAWPGK